MLFRYSLFFILLCKSLSPNASAAENKNAYSKDFLEGDELSSEGPDLSGSLDLKGFTALGIQIISSTLDDVLKVSPNSKIHAGNLSSYVCLESQDGTTVKFSSGIMRLKTNAITLIEVFRKQEKLSFRSKCSKTHKEFKGVTFLNGLSLSSNKKSILKRLKKPSSMSPRLIGYHYSSPETDTGAETISGVEFLFIGEIVVKITLYSITSN
ncbi:MAG: hypothetical protein EOP04_06335 [Proteobacteria bacterium]|nr:MAG: hypothetical protein EOP04_06335 [Pseudomonadota bacterium]